MSPRSRAEHVAVWEQLHGVPASGLVARWLGLLHTPATWLRVPPSTLTAAAVAVAALALAVPAPVAAALVVLSAVLDGLDGAVAVVHDRVTRLGAVLDAVGDRVCDGLFLAALVLAGAPLWLAVATGVGVLLLELTRVAVRRPVTVTVGERPTRVLCIAPGLLLTPVAGAPTAALGLLGVLTLVALVQLARALTHPSR